MMPENQFVGSNEVRYVIFRCLVCKELDRGKFYEHEPIPPIINCWNCHAGMGLHGEGGIQDVRPMLQAGKGMVSAIGAKMLGVEPPPTVWPGDARPDLGSKMIYGGDNFQIVDLGSEPVN